MQIEYLEHYRQLGINVAYYRKRRGFSQEQLAESANISRTHMSRIETADIGISLDTLFNLAKALGVEPFQLLQTKD